MLVAKHLTISKIILTWPTTRLYDLFDNPN
jgi:hypothetical protein